MENPLKFVPFIACRLKELEELKAISDDKQYKKASKRLLKVLTTNKTFVKVLLKNISESEDDMLKKESRALGSDASTSLGFSLLWKVTAVVAVLMQLGLFGEDASNMYLYPFCAAIVAFGFYLYYGNTAGKHMNKCVMTYLDRYEKPSSRFSDEKIRLMLDVRCSAKDVINPAELNNNIACGCYSCMAQFTSEKLTAREGDTAYRCPICGEETIISERCGLPISDALLEDMHEYWIA